MEWVRIVIFGLGCFAAGVIAMHAKTGPRPYVALIAEGPLPAKIQADLKVCTADLDRAKEAMTRLNDAAGYAALQLQGCIERAGR